MLIPRNTNLGIRLHGDGIYLNEYTKTNMPPTASMTRYTANYGYLIQNATWLQCFTSLEWPAMRLLGELTSRIGISKQNCQGLQARRLHHRHCCWHQCYKQKQITFSTEHTRQNRVNQKLFDTKW